MQGHIARDTSMGRSGELWLFSQTFCPIKFLPLIVQMIALDKSNQCYRVIFAQCSCAFVNILTDIEHYSSA
jgi:hypothetical protein